MPPAKKQKPNCSTAFLPLPTLSVTLPARLNTHRPLVLLSLTPPPLSRSRGPKPLAYSAALSQCAQALQSYPRQPSKLTIELPPEYSETRAGTLVSRYENNLNFAEKLLASLNASNVQSVGGTVEICDNVNPQGGGEYLTDDEVIVGLRAETEMGPVSLLMNAGVDIDTLKQVEALQNAAGFTILLNCGLERMSWLDKLRLGKYFESFQVLYCLKRVGGSGWLFKCGREDWGIWVDTPGGLKLLSTSGDRPKIFDVERKVRLAILALKKSNWTT